MRRYLFAPSLVLAVALAAGPREPLAGQELPWLAGGQLRLDFTPSFWGWTSRFGYRTDPSGGVVEEVESLGMDLTADPLGSEILPYLQPLESELRSALQDGGYQLRLGVSQAVVQQSRLVFPFRLDVGITDWLTVGAMVPFVRPRTELTFALDADSLSADVGLTPGTGSFLSTFDAVLTSAEATNPGDPTVLASRAYLDALAAAYAYGSVFPAMGSTTGAQLQARLDDLRTALEAEGVTGVPETIPLAEAYMDQEAFNSLLTSPAMRAYPLEDWTTPRTMGDVEITAAVRLLRHGFQPDSLGELPFLRAQVGIQGLVRLGTGGLKDPDRFLITDPADGQMDFEGSVFGLVEVGSRFGGWWQARYGIQQEGEAIRRIAGPSEILPPVSRMAPLNRTPGNYFDFQINPRFYFTPEMTFGLRYRFWAKGEDRYALAPMDPETQALRDYPPALLLNYETRERLQELGISATYSTLAAHARGEARFPLQVRFTYLRPLSGAGGQTPKGGRFEAGLSIFKWVWGGGNGRVEDTGTG